MNQVHTKARTGSSLDLRHSAGFIGTEVRGLELRSGLDAATLTELRALLTERLVLFFPQQNLSMSELKAFGQLWGTLEVDDSAAHVRSAEDPEVVELKASVGYVADMWHTDLTPMPNAECRCRSRE